MFIEKGNQIGHRSK